ncbi:MAG: inositol monophosphatase, partial [Streptosporangiales bacterium]|nr:inositol monophosphatase [Streptosporangiales bacterium]
ATKSSDSDFVTAADLAADDAIARAITAARPDDAIKSEESGRRAGTSGITWVVDPLDGTMNFVHHRDEYAVSVGVEQDGDYVAGAIVRPTSGAWIAAGDGVVRAREGRPGVTGTTDPEAAMFSVGLAGDADMRARMLDMIGDLLPIARDFRRSGSSACELADLAMGRVDVYLGFGVKDWDVAAGIAVVRAAGGRAEWVETESGLPLLAAGTPAVFDQFVERAAKV